MNGASGDEWASNNSPPMIIKTSKTGASHNFLFFLKNRRNSLMNDTRLLILVLE